MVNERGGVSILSENTGAHEELGEYALSVNPFDIQELADSIHAALTMPAEERERRLQGLKSIVTARDAWGLPNRQLQRDMTYRQYADQLDAIRALPLPIGGQGVILAVVGPFQVAVRSPARRARSPSTRC